MSFSLKHLAQLTQYGAVALLMWLGAGLFWQLLSPKPHSASLRLAQEAPKSFNPDAVLRLFKTSNTTTIANEASGLSLKALISGRAGIAIIEGLEASAVAVKVGSDLGQYGKLMAANSDHIVLEHQGVQKKIFLPASAVASNANAPSTAQQATAAVTQSAPLSITLTRGQLTGILQGGNLANWSKGLNTSTAGGIVVEQASQQQLAQVLQLRDGDILKAINGRPLNKLDDLSLLYGAFSQQTNLTLQIQRQDQPQSISYTVNP